MLLSVKYAETMSPSAYGKEIPSIPVGGRFGTYLLNGNYPVQNTGQSLSSNGTTNGDNWWDFSLSPANIAEKEAGQVFNMFPQEYNSAVGQSFEYLLSLPDENCTRSGDLGLGNRYSNGILCGAPLSALKVFTRNHSGGDLILTVFDRATKAELAQQRVPHINITDKKQGYSIPVISNDMWGRGACTNFPSMPASDCSVSPDLLANKDPSYEQSHVRLDSVCESVDCGENGICSARYLGSALPVLPAYQCVCKEGWSGVACQNAGVLGGGGNRAPELTLTPSISIDENTSKRVNFAVSDPENDALTIAISVLTGEGLTAELLDSKDGFTITAPNITADQTYTIEILSRFQSVTALM